MRSGGVLASVVLGVLLGVSSVAAIGRRVTAGVELAPGASAWVSIQALEARTRTQHARMLEDTQSLADESGSLVQENADRKAEIATLKAELMVLRAELAALKEARR